MDNTRSLAGEICRKAGAEGATAPELSGKRTAMGDELLESEAILMASTEGVIPISWGKSLRSDDRGATLLRVWTHA